MLGSFESADAVRSWAQRLIEGQRESQYAGGCPIATLGTGLMDLDADTLTQIARIFRRCEDGIRAGYRTMHANNDLAPDADPDALATMTWLRRLVVWCSPNSTATPSLCNQLSTPCSAACGRNFASKALVSN